MDFEILVLNNIDGHWKTDIEYYRSVTFIIVTMHYFPNSPYRQIIRFHYYNRGNLIWCYYNNA